MNDCTNMSSGLTIGLDLGDESSVLHVLDVEGRTVEGGKVRTREVALRKRFGSLEPSRVVLETGTHSPWVSRVLEECGHEVIVANARRVETITKNSRKSDEMDAKLLAKLGRIDPELLSPVHHRGHQAQVDHWRTPPTVAETASVAFSPMPLVICHFLFLPPVQPHPSKPKANAAEQHCVQHREHRRVRHTKLECRIRVSHHFHRVVIVRYPTERGPFFTAPRSSGVVRRCHLR